MKHKGKHFFSIKTNLQLVSHEIEAGGSAFSGGPSPNGPVAGGLHFEITLLQLYKVALSAGKAHRDHKHHHVHHFDHNGEIMTTQAPPTTVSSHSQPHKIFKCHITP